MVVDSYGVAQFLLLFLPTKPTLASSAWLRTVYMLYWLNAECWSETNGVRGYDGVAHDFSTVNECRSACVNNYACAGVDWDPSNAPESCWILTSNATAPAEEYESVTHYELRRICLQSQSHLYHTQFVFRIQHALWPLFNDLLSLNNF